MLPIGDNIRSRHYPLVNTGIITACVVVFFAQHLVPGFQEQWVFKPEYLFSLHQWLTVGPSFIFGTIVASMFMHGGLTHLGFNMLFLWVFGDNVEDRMGHLRYLAFYLICGVAATVAHSFLAGLGQLLVPMPAHLSTLHIPLVGASGAIAGVLAAYYRLFPGAYIRTLVVFFFITFVYIPAAVFIGVWFLFQLFYLALGPLAGGGVAYGAHVGGFAVGYVLCVYFCWMPRKRTPPPRVVDLRFLD